MELSNLDDHPSQLLTPDLIARRRQLREEHQRAVFRYLLSVRGIEAVPEVPADGRLHHLGNCPRYLETSPPRPQGENDPSLAECTCVSDCIDRAVALSSWVYERD